MAQNEKKTNTVNDTLKFPLAEAFEKDLTARLEAANEVEAVCLAMLDMDSLKGLNDSYGHGAGDAALIAIGQCLQEHMPAGSQIYRYAGDEFAVIFPEETEKEDAFLLMEQARSNLKMTREDQKPLTFTVGIAAAPEDATRYHDLVRKADGAMYRGKLAGANKVCLAREEKMVTKTSHYTADQLQRLTKLSKREGVGEAVLLREALDALLNKYDYNL